MKKSAKRQARKVLALKACHPKSVSKKIEAEKATKTKTSAGRPKSAK